MKVTGWTHWDNDDYERDLDSLSMDTYLDIEEAVIKEIKDKGYKFSGQYHQHGEYGCPIVDNEYVYQVSMRKWGGIIARAHSLPNEDGLAYVMWAWCKPNNEKEIYPEGENK